MGNIIDSAMTLEEALAGKEILPEIRNDLVLLDVAYISFDGQAHLGQLVVHRKARSELKEIFRKLFEIKFPIEKAVPIVAHNWIDEDSMAANNTSAFNHRPIYGTNRLSNHSYGLAIDINPVLNPYVAADGTVFPRGAAYDPARSGTLTAGGEAVKLFADYGWKWGGTWQKKDWQHFEKPEHK